MGDGMVAQALMDYDDLYIKSNDLSGHNVPTVMAVAHNEMYFFPAWLEHYRSLGAQRFIVLDDASTDGTLEYLSHQPDVMVLGSKRRYGDTVTVISRADSSGETLKSCRMVHIWRMIMPEKFSLNRWVLQVALDEFLKLPYGYSLEEIFQELEPQEFDAIIGTMLDTYPASIGDMRANKGGQRFDFSDDWYFDALPHRSPVSPTRLLLYQGSRARLFHDFLLPSSAREWMHYLRHIFTRSQGRAQYPRTNSTRKYALVRWRSDGWMHSSHRINLAISPRHHLPILHMKFTGDLYRRAEVAIRDKAYYQGGVGYMRLVNLLRRMDKRNSSFMCPWSASIHDEDAFHNAQLYLGFDQTND